jgi:hypothetical protein
MCVRVTARRQSSKDSTLRPSQLQGLFVTVHLLKQFVRYRAKVAERSIVSRANFSSGRGS